MSRTLRFPKEKAMALGGVATGSMKAREAAMVHGSITYSGCILTAMAFNTPQHKNTEEMRVSCASTSVILVQLNFLFIFFTIEASIGRKRVVVAVLLEHSVKVATSRDSRMEMAKGGILCSGVS